MPTRIVEFDVLGPGCEIPFLETDENLLVILRSGFSLVGKLFVTGEKCSAVASDLEKYLPKGISPFRFRQARERIQRPDQPPTTLPWGDVRETFELENARIERASSQPEFTVIVCSRHRRECLIRCLESILQLDYGRYKVVLVDNNGPGEGIFDVAGRFPCRYIKEVRPGLSRSLNAGLAEATGELVAITHDNAEVDPAWLKGLALEFEDPQVGAVSGPVLPLDLSTRAQEWFEELRCLGPPWLGRLVFEPGDLPLEIPLGSDANLAFRKERIEAQGGFNESLGSGTWSGGAEDQEALIKILRAGSKVVFTPDALVRHRHSTSLEEVQSAAFRRSVARTALATSLIHEERTLWGTVLSHVLKGVVGRGQGPRVEPLGLPRARLPWTQRLAAFFIGPLAYCLSHHSESLPWTFENDDSP